MLKIPINSKPFRFILIGLWNTLLGYLAFCGLEILVEKRGAHYFVALILSQIVVLANAYLCYKFLVFRTTGLSFSEPTRFIFIYGMNCVVNFFLLPCFIHAFDMTPIMAQAIVVLILSLANYASHNYFTFRQKPVS